jgi:hypothetical protein
MLEGNRYFKYYYLTIQLIVSLEKSIVQGVSKSNVEWLTRTSDPTGKRVRQLMSAHDDDVMCDIAPRAAHYAQIIHFGTKLSLA